MHTWLKAVPGTRCRNAHMFAEGGHTQPLGCAGFAYIFFCFKAKKIPYFSLSFALNEYERRTRGAPVSLKYFFHVKAKKISYFSLIFALSGYERRTLYIRPAASKPRHRVEQPLGVPLSSSFPCPPLKNKKYILNIRRTLLSLESG